MKYKKANKIEFRNFKDKKLWIHVISVVNIIIILY